MERKSEPVKEADKSQLKTALAKANDILSVDANKDTYTEATYNALKEARDAGQDVLIIIQRLKLKLIRQQKI